MHIIYHCCVQGEDVILGNTLLPDSHEGMEHTNENQGGHDKKLGGVDRKTGSLQEKLDWISVSTSGNVPQARYYVCTPL